MRLIRDWTILKSMVVALLLSFISLVPAIAQSENPNKVEVPEALQPEAINSFVSRLNEEQTATLVISS
jgi:hypothetical protein